MSVKDELERRDGTYPDESSGVEKTAGCDVCFIKPWTSEGCLGTGNYSFKDMCCKFGLPFCMKTVPPPHYFAKDEKLPLLLSLFLGLQHCLAMLVGIATSGGRLIANDTCFSFQRDTQMCERMPWMISVAWITSGILTAIQVFRLKLGPSPYFLGTGLISVMGTSFTFLPIARTMTLDAISDAKGNPCEEDADGAPIFTGECCGPDGFGNPGRGDCSGAGAIGYGKFLGTCLVACLFEIGISFLPAWIIKKLFPPVVTGSVIMLIGGGLIGAGIKYVGGGVFCAENAESKMAIGIVQPTGPDTAGGGMPHMCDENGEIKMAFGSPEYVGLAFSCIFFSIILQIFGSPFFKSTFIFWSLCFADCKEVEISIPDESGSGSSMVKETLNYFDSQAPPNAIKNADDITFLWAEGTFDIGFSGIYFFPILIGFFISTAETVGDVTMTCVYSAVDDEAEISSRVQGGLLADGINSFLACLFGSPPNTTFSQNNGLIALTRCASRSAGFSCAFWLILLGMFGKFGAAFASIPMCVIGGVVLQMFSSVFVSGMKVATSDFTRRNQFILTLALGLGLGVAMEGHIFDWPGPYAFVRKNLAYDYGFWPQKKVCTTPNAGWIDDDGLCHDTGFFTNGINNGNCCLDYDTEKKGVRTAVLMMLKTPYCIGFLVAFILNLIIPEDTVEGESSGPTIGPGKGAAVDSSVA